MNNSYLFDSKDLNFMCPICLEHKNLNTYKKKSFLKPNEWDFKILYCGHVLCNQCYKLKKFKSCPLCKKNTKVNSYTLITRKKTNQSWNTLDEWFTSFYDKIGDLFYRNLKHWKPNKDSWSGIYSYVYETTKLIVQRKKN